MRIRLKPGPFISIAAAFLLAGAAVLGFLQVRWVGEAANAEEIRLRSSLLRGAGQVRMEAEDEVRALLSLAQPSAADVKAARWDGIEVNLSFWLEYSRFPRLLRGIYIIRQPPARDAFAYSLDSRDFSPAALPADVASALAAVQTGRDESGARSSSVLPDGTLLIALSVSAQGGDRSQAASALVAVVLDSEVMYTSVVPFYMKQNLEGYPFRVVSAASGSALYESGAPAASAKPEVEASLNGFSSFFRQRGERGSFPEEGPESLFTNPLLQPWLQRAQGNTALPAEPPGPAAGKAGVFLQIFYPGGSIAGILRRQSALNIGISLGIIGAFLASLLVLFRLYGRTVRLRASEQEFVASISHELRTPISVIQAASDNLSRGIVEDPARLPRYADVIHGQIKRLSTMVESILLYAGLESGGGRRPAIADIDLPAFLAEVVGPLEELARSQGSILKYTAEALPARIRSDAMALRLIVENLVVNAVRHAGPCEISLTVGLRPFEELRIAVEDGGRGIPAREQRKVFEPFFRGEESVSGQRPGSGLGLHLVKRVAVLLGGKVTLESPYENLAGIGQNGCRFVVILPIEEGDGKAG